MTSLTVVYDLMQDHKSWQVHCINGANRSVFFMTALVMAYCQVDAQTAYEHIGLLRNIADLEPKWLGRVLMTPLAFLVSHQERLHGLFFDLMDYAHLGCA